MLLSGSPWNWDGGLGPPPVELTNAIRYRPLRPLPRKLGDHPSHHGVAVHHALIVRGQLVENLREGAGSGAWQGILIGLISTRANPKSRTNVFFGLEGTVASGIGLLQGEQSEASKAVTGGFHLPRTYP